MSTPHRPHGRAPNIPPQTSRQVDKPEPGFFAYRPQRGAAHVAARIEEAFDLWTVTIDGRKKGEPTDTPLSNQSLLSVWTYGRMIDETEYRRLLAVPAENRVSPAQRPSVF